MASDQMATMSSSYHYTECMDDVSVIVFPLYDNFYIKRILCGTGGGSEEKCMVNGARFSCGDVTVTRRSFLNCRIKISLRELCCRILPVVKIWLYSLYIFLKLHPPFEVCEYVWLMKLAHM